MTGSIRYRMTGVALIAMLGVGAVSMRAQKAELSGEKPGNPPRTFEPIVGSWVVARDGSDNVVMVDGRPWVASKDNPTRLLIESARKLYGTSNEELMDNAKQFAYYPVALFKGVDNFSNGTISVDFKTIAGTSDRASGIVFNVKNTGDWLALRYNDTEQNIALWEFHNGIRRMVKRGEEGAFALDRNAWHKLTVTVAGAEITAAVDGKPALAYTLGSAPTAGRRGPPHEDLYPANNPVLRPPVSGRVGLWSKTDSTSYFKEFVVRAEK